MKFKLTCQSGNVFYYDNVQNVFYDRYKNYLPLDSFVESLPYHQKIEYFNERSYIFSDRKPEIKRGVNLPQLYHVKFQFGLNCNYKCLYCSQRICGIQPKERIDLDSLKKKILNSPLDWGKIRTIELWGGEPLVYWKFFKELVEFFRHETDFKGYFHTTTNAELFDDEKCQFFHDNDVKAMFSHDGVNHKYTRNVNDWLDNDKIRNAVINFFYPNGKLENNGTIHAVFAPMFNTNIFDSLELFYNKIAPNAPITLNTGMRCDGTNQYLMAHFDPEKVESCKKSWFDVLTATPDNKYYGMLDGTRKMIWRDINCLVYGRLAASYVHNCPTKSKENLTFDMQGRYIPCHGSSFAQGLSSGDIEHLNECVDFGFKSMHHRQYCTTCPIIQCCGGPCGFISDRDALYFCKSTKWNHETVFKAEFYILTHELIETFEPTSDEGFYD